MKVKKYSTRNTLSGALVDRKFSGRELVAVPESKLPYPSETLVITIKKTNQVMFLLHKDIPKMLKSLPFSDRYGRGFYNLCYFDFKPYKKPEQIKFDFGGDKNA